MRINIVRTAGAATGLALAIASAAFGLSQPQLDGNVVAAVFGWAVGMLIFGASIDPDNRRPW